VWSGVAGDPTVSVSAGPSTPAPATVGPEVVPTAPAVHVVQPGETLWSIARGVQPTGDVRPLVDELADRVGGAGLQAGQRIDLGGLAD
jgi:LysM repeat protein